MNKLILNESAKKVPVIPLRPCKIYCIVLYFYIIQADHESGFSKKGKTPWITYNDSDVADSQFCIEFLNEKLSE